MEKVKLLNVFFASAKSGSQESQTQKERLGERRHSLGKGRSGQISSKQTQCTQIHGPQWDVHVSSEGAGRNGCQIDL